MTVSDLIRLLRKEVLLHPKAAEAIVLLSTRGAIPSGSMQEASHVVGLTRVGEVVITDSWEGE